MGTQMDYISLAEIASFQQGKQVSVDLQFNKPAEGLGRFVRIVDYTNKNEPPRYIKDMDKKYHVNEDDLVMIRYGSQTAGSVVRGIPGIIANNMFQIKLDNQDYDKGFLYYYLSSKEVKNQLMGGQSSSTMPAITFGMMKNVMIPVVSFVDQRRIAGFLDGLSKKIRLNEEINENLTEQARTMFQQWLGKANGSLCHLTDIADINPETYSTKDNWEFVNYLDTSNITTGIIAEVQYIQPSHEKLPSRARRILRKNDIVYSTVRPNQLHYGIISNPFPNMLGSTGFAVIRSKRDTIPNEIIYLALTAPSFVEKMHQLAEQSVSTYPSIKPLDLNVCVFPEPQQEDTDFTNAIKTIFGIIASNNEENRRLAELRDTLLPRLMSGELDVSDFDL